MECKKSTRVSFLRGETSVHSEIPKTYSRLHTPFQSPLTLTTLLRDSLSEGTPPVVIRLVCCLFYPQEVGRHKDRRRRSGPNGRYGHSALVCPLTVRTLDHAGGDTRKRQDALVESREVAERSGEDDPPGDSRVVRGRTEETRKE